MGKTYVEALSSGNPVYAFSFAFDSIQTLVNSLRLISNWGIVGTFSGMSLAPVWMAGYLGNPAVQFLLFAVPLLALASVLFLRQTADLLIYLLMLVTILLGASSNPPAGSTFVWVITSFPLLRPFYNGETFSPILLIFYATFSSLTVAKIASFLDARAVSKNSLTPTRSAQNNLKRRSTAGIRSAAGGVACFTILLVILATNYPALSTSYMLGNPSTPVASSLPRYYLAANSYLQQTDSNGPVMVFPEAPAFGGHGTGNQSWYQGIDIFPTLIQNPSISTSTSPIAVHSPGNNASVPGFLYGIGKTTPFFGDCMAPMANLIPEPAPYLADVGPQLVTKNSSQIEWNSSFSTDSLLFSGAFPNEIMQFSINTSDFIQNGHWLTGTFPAAQNFSMFNYAIVRWTSHGLDADDLQFGYHSVRYGAGNGFVLSDYPTLQTGSANFTILPLADPRIEGGGNLSKVVDVFFTYDPPSAQVGLGSLNVTGLFFSTALNQSAVRWVEGTDEDKATVLAGSNGSILNFIVNTSTYETNGHWALGFFAQPENMSEYSYVMINYSLRNMNPTYLQFGFHSGPGEYSAGSGYVLGNLSTEQIGTNLSTAVPLDSPTISINENLSTVSNVFFVYTPPSSIGTTKASLSVSALWFCKGAPTGAALLAEDLSRLGIEFAYVDSSTQDLAVPTMNGSYYNQLFSESSQFKLGFSSGSVSIYRDLLYVGPFSAESNVTADNGPSIKVGGQYFNSTNAYLNVELANRTFVPASDRSITANLSSAEVVHLDRISPTDFSVIVHSSGPFLLVFRESYSPEWTAVATGVGALSGPIFVDGSGNGWIIPRGVTTIVISFRGQAVYQVVETALIAIPFVMLALFLFPALRNPRWFLTKLLATHVPRRVERPHFDKVS